MKFYSELAEWWPLISPLEDYRDEARFYWRVLRDAAHPKPIRSMLELGCGGGHVAAHMPEDVEIVLSDLSPDMLTMSRKIHPNREHVIGDMRSLRLERTFDAVLIHDAVMYMTTEEDLASALATAGAHLREGGAFLVCPDLVSEDFRPGPVAGGGTNGPGRAAQVFEWSYRAGAEESEVQTEYVFLLRDDDGRVRCEHETHVTGLFPRATWHRLIEAAGFERVEFQDDSTVEHGEVFSGRKRASS